MVRKIIKRHLKKLPKEEDIQRISELSKKKIGEISKDNLSKLSKLERFLYYKPIIKVPLVLLGVFLLRLFFYFNFSEDSLILSDLSFIVMFLLSLYLIFFVVYLIKHSFQKLLTATSFISLFFSYMLFIVSVLLLFTSAYDLMEKTDNGYLKYGECSDLFNPTMIQKDPQLSHNYFYFSSVTLFTVGYGDICPMGWDKYLALINAFIGNFINVVIMVIVISNYLKRREN